MFLDLVVTGKSNPNASVWSEKPNQSSTKKKYFDYIGKFLNLAYNNVYFCLYHSADIPMTTSPNLSSIG
jgi:hypothetical protein